MSICLSCSVHCRWCFFFQAEDGIRDADVTGVQTCALPISEGSEYYRISPSLTHFTIKPIGTCFNELFRQFAVLSPLRHSITTIRSTGILTRWPSTSPFGCALGPD